MNYQRLDSTLPNSRLKQRAINSRKLAKRKLADAQIEKLLTFALREHQEDARLAEQHSKLAWNISTRFNIRLKHNRLLFCHHCKMFIVPPSTSRIRLSKRRRGINITCLRCDSTYRVTF